MLAASQSAVTESPGAVTGLRGGRRRAPQKHGSENVFHHQDFEADVTTVGPTTLRVTADSQAAGGGTRPPRALALGNTPRPRLCPLVCICKAAMPAPPPQHPRGREQSLCSCLRLVLGQSPHASPLWDHVVTAASFGTVCVTATRGDVGTASVEGCTLHRGHRGCGSLHVQVGDAGHRSVPVRRADVVGWKRGEASGTRASL